MRPGDRALQGVPHAHTKQNNSDTHPPYRAGNCQPGRQLCCAVPRCVLCWCCAVMWLLHPLSASPVFQRGGPPWPPILFLTSHSIFSLLRRSFLPCLLSPSACLPACLVVCLLAPIERESASLSSSGCKQMSSFNNGRLSEKRPANRDPQYPSRLPAAGRAGCDRNLDDPRDPPRRWALGFELDIAPMSMPFSLC